MSETLAKPELVAYCGLYCGACFQPGGNLQHQGLEPGIVRQSPVALQLQGVFFCRKISGGRWSRRMGHCTGKAGLPFFGCAGAENHVRWRGQG